ncbi:MAG: glutamate racemase [Chitinophagales bacterium]
MNIAFFDSGVGGISVLKEALTLLPDENYLYFADSQNAPYGTKDSDLIRTLMLDATDFLVKQNLKALVVACNTGTSVAIKDLRKKYDFPIIGMEPAIKPALQNHPTKNVLVFATERTLLEDKFHALVSRLEAKDRVKYLPLQELVMLAEKFEFEESIILPYLQEKLKDIDWSLYSSIVLGCTHFIYFYPHFLKVIPKEVQIFDGNKGTVRQLKKKLKQIKQTHTESSSSKEMSFYISKEKADKKLLEKYLEVL